MLTVMTPREIVPEAEREMLAHGCRITPHTDYSEITFPEGTTRTEILPRMSGGERLKLVLPDGYVMMQQYVRYLDQHILFCSRKGMLTGTERQNDSRMSALLRYIAHTQLHAASLHINL